jgi:hypothetical protein
VNTSLAFAYVYMRLLNFSNVCIMWVRTLLLSRPKFVFTRVMPTSGNFKQECERRLLGVGALSTGRHIDWHMRPGRPQTSQVHIPEVWIQAQASVQAQLDQEVIAEAADLAEAQWSEMTLVARLTQARGKSVDLDVGGIRCNGVLTEISASGDFILMRCIDGELARACEYLIRINSLNSARGLPRGLVPVVEALARTRIGFREGSWLRGQWGNRVVIRTYNSSNPVHGIVAAVGRDFIELENGGGIEMRLVVALGSVISMKVVA